MEQEKSHCDGLANSKPRHEFYIENVWKSLLGERTKAKNPGNIDDL